MILAARHQGVQRPGRIEPWAGVRFGIHVTIKPTLPVCTGCVPLGPAPEDETCSTIDSRGKRSSRPRHRSIKAFATARGSSSSARSLRFATGWTSSKGELLASSASSLSWCGNATEPGVEPRRPDRCSRLDTARVRARLTDVLGWSAGDEHRHVRVVGRDERLVRLSQRVSHGVT
jgi:hypothetical protein